MNQPTFTPKSDRPPQLTYKRQTRKARYFLERLSDDVAIEMMSIPSGSFLMGSPETELERRENEGPQREVEVEAFFMGKYPVTQDQWKAIVSLPQVDRDLNPNPSRFKGSDRPVERVSWYDAIEACARLAQHSGKSYRLPSEAEWEYACRAGTATPFHFGETIAQTLANYRGTSTYGYGPKGDFRQETTSVGHFKVANAFGLSDMHGNVWEWCEDVWHASYAGAPPGGTPWNKGGKEEYRVLRGGSWDLEPWYCRSAYRVRDEPDLRGSSIGFRVVCSAARVST